MFLPDTSVVTATATTVSGVQLKRQLDLVKATLAAQAEFLDWVVLLHILAVTDPSVDLAVTAD